jgi:hypothetical protein
MSQNILVMFQGFETSRGCWTRHKRDMRDMTRRTPTDNSRALAHLLHNRPIQSFSGSGNKDEK